LFINSQSERLQCKKHHPQLADPPDWTALLIQVNSKNLNIVQKFIYFSIPLKS